MKTKTLDDVTENIKAILSVNPSIEDIREGATLGGRMLVVELEDLKLRIEIYEYDWVN